MSLELWVKYAIMIYDLEYEFYRWIMRNSVYLVVMFGISLPLVLVPWHVNIHEREFFSRIPPFFSNYDLWRYLCRSLLLDEYNMNLVQLDNKK